MRKKIFSLAVVTLMLAVAMSAFMPATAKAAALLTEQQGKLIADEAEKWDYRVKYRTGGYTDPNQGFDTTGFVKYVYAQFGIELPHNIYQLARTGEYVSYSNLQPGDVLFFGSSSSDLETVAIYKGNGRFIGASSYYNGVVEKSLYYFRRNYVGARRMYQAASQPAQPVEDGQNQTDKDSDTSTPAQPPATEQPVTGESKYGDRIVREAKKYLGVPYVFGSSASTTNSFDCSSFVQRAVYDAGLGKLPRTARAQASYLAKYGKSVSRSELQPGDILFWKNMGSHVPAGTVSHVGIYIGDNKFIHAWPNKGVTIMELSSYFTSSSRVAGAYRIVKPVD